MAFGIGMQPYTPMDREYSVNEPREPFGPVDEVGSTQIEQPIVGTKEMGVHVYEDQRLGNLNQQVKAMIQRGASRVELQLAPSSAVAPQGAQAYGLEARQDLRELARAANIEYTSVHTPSSVGNLSGFNPQEGSFSDQMRDMSLEEVKKAIKFAGDAAGGGAVVVHTGEFQRPIFEAKWNTQGKWKDSFVSYDEEPEKASIMLIDQKTGRAAAQGINRSQVVYEPVFHTADNSPTGNSLVGVYDEGKGAKLEPGDFVDIKGKWINPINSERLFERVPVWDKDRTNFKTHALTWKDFQNRADQYNQKFHTDFSADELFVRAQLENNVLQSKGHSLFYAVRYEDHKKRRDAALKALEFFKKIEANTPKEEQWRLLRSQPVLGDLAPSEDKLPSEILQHLVKEETDQMVHIHQASASADVQAADALERMKHIVTAERFAKEKTTKSYAEAGIYAMKESQENPYTKRDIFVAPENIFPEMGYGSHPEELIELVKTSREQMAHMLTDRYIEIPSGHRLTKEEVDRWNRDNPDWKRKEGDVALIANPYLTDMSYNEAYDKAKKHIKATFDTAHLGMWWKHFKAQPGETEKDRKERFDKWYMEQVENMSKAGILGHIHVVDSITSDHAHLPAGQGIFPVVDAVHYLKKMGYDGTMISEGWWEQADRQLFQAWQAFGTTIYSAARPGAPVRFGDIHESYFGHHRPPYTIVGQYVPSNDWTLWTQVPLE